MLERGRTLRKDPRPHGRRLTDDVRRNACTLRAAPLIVPTSSSIDSYLTDPTVWLGRDQVFTESLRRLTVFERARRSVGRDTRKWNFTYLRPTS
jgi:hypothetical protein